MSTPAIAPSFPDHGEFHEDRRNGQGIWTYMPTTPAPLSESLPHLGEFDGFLELPQVVNELVSHRTVLVEGAPGSGKSHLVESILNAGVMHDVPMLGLSLHVNGGQANGVERVAPQVEQFKEATAETGGLVILDNVDYVGYRGNHRQRSRAAKYAEAVQPFAQELLDDPNLAVLGTAHDAAWREGRWTWLDESIDGPAHQMLNGFNTRMVFEGKMALVSLAHLIRERNLARSEGQGQISVGQAAMVMRRLHALGRANFFHANHLDLQAFLDDPRSAIEQIDAARDERRGKK